MNEIKHTLVAPEYLSEKDAAQMLCVSRITLQRERLAGRIEFYRVGGSRVVYDHAQLQAYLDQRRQAAYNPRQPKELSHAA